MSDDDTQERATIIPAQPGYSTIKITKSDGKSGEYTISRLPIIAWQVTASQSGGQTIHATDPITTKGAPPEDTAERSIERPDGLIECWDGYDASPYSLTDWVQCFVDSDYAHGDSEEWRVSADGQLLENVRGRVSSAVIDQTALYYAAHRLDPDNDSHWLSDGSICPDALSAIAGLRIEPVAAQEFAAHRSRGDGCFGYNRETLRKRRAAQQTAKAV